MKWYAIIFIFITNVCYSQNIQIQYYSPLEKQTNENSKRIQISTLKVNKHHSLFEMNEVEGYFDSNFGWNGKGQVPLKETWFFKNYKSQKLFSYESVVEQYYLIKEKIPQINWEIHEESKIIGNFKCSKATATFRGREYEAWFTSELPLSNGPWKLGGLPGLILEAYDKDKIVVFLFKSFNILDDSSEIIRPSIKNVQATSPEKRYQLMIDELEERLKFVEAKLKKQGTNIQISLNVNNNKLWEIF